MSLTKTTSTAGGLPAMDQGEGTVRDRRFLLPIGAFVCLAALTVADPAASQPHARPGASASAGAVASSPADRADELYRKGISAGGAKDWPQAFQFLWEAYQLKKSYDIEGNLGTAELRLGKYQAAAEHLAHSLTLFPVNGSPEAKARTEGLLEEAKKEVGVLRIKVTPAGALVKVGGRQLGAGDSRDQLFVDPGEMRVEAGGVDDYEGTSQSVKVAKGQVVDVVLALRLKAGAAASGTSTSGPAATTAPGVSGPNKAVVIGGSVLAGVSLIAGGVLFGLATGMQGDLQHDAPKNSDGTLACVANPPAGTNTQACDDFRERARSANVFGQAGVGLFIAGGALAAGTLIYGLWPRDTKKAAGAHLTPVAAPGTAGLVLTGSF